jgi:hypothetical protein
MRQEIVVDEKVMHSGKTAVEKKIEQKDMTSVDVSDKQVEVVVHRDWMLEQELPIQRAVLVQMMQVQKVEQSEEKQKQLTLAMNQLMLMWGLAKEMLPAWMKVRKQVHETTAAAAEQMIEIVTSEQAWTLGKRPQMGRKLVLLLLLRVQPHTVAVADVVGMQKPSWVEDVDKEMRWIAAETTVDQTY